MSKPSIRTPPSSNWLSLKKTLDTKSSKNPSRTVKRRKIDHDSDALEAGPSRVPPSELEDSPPKTSDVKSLLKQMAMGESVCTDQQKQPGKYLALDCEMVGVGIDGSESSLARVSLVNYYGVVQLDEFVRQRERVVDYRTQYSGIRERDMAKAKPFEEIQAQVAGLLKDRILVGHAVFNDLKALLLSHPRPQTVDTQYYAWKFKVTKSKYIALRNLVKQELDLTIQGGEHSSVTDARATMAVFRLHKQEWEKNLHPPPSSNKKKRKREVTESGGDEEEEEAENDGAVDGFPGGGKKGVSSGLSTIIHRKGKGKSSEPAAKKSGSKPSKTKKGWWKDLGGVSKRSS